MHTILGAGGPVANVLCRELEAKNERVRLFSRREIKTSGTTDWKKGDLLDYSSLREAAKGSTVIYLCVGFVYDSKIWEQNWPKGMQNAIDLAKENNARLLFFDNVYMYGKVEGPMLENTPYNPCSRKGEVRARIAQNLQDQFKSGALQGSIARAADFYGSETGNSFFDLMVLSPLSKGKKPSWLGHPERLHSFTGAGEAAHGMFLLGQDSKTDQQVWHMPTAAAQKGCDFLAQAAEVYQWKGGFTRINFLMLNLAALGNKAIKGSLEMYYQNRYDYVFNSDKFNTYFKYEPISYKAGFKALSKSMYKKGETQ